MATWQNIGGTWRAGNWWQNVAGIWKRCNTWQNIAGTWRNLSVQFSPDGGDQYSSGLDYAEVALTCSEPAVWTYSGGGLGTSVNTTSGSTTSRIVFSARTAGSPGNRQPRSGSWNVTGRANGVERTFTVTVEAQGDNVNNL